MEIQLKRLAPHPKNKRAAFVDFYIEEIEQTIRCIAIKMPKRFCIYLPTNEKGTASLVHFSPAKYQEFLNKTIPLIEKFVGSS